MKEQLHISKSKPHHKSMDFDFLRLKGIEYAQMLSGAIWTDYNEHDPGVTILEYLCFAITDLGYRSNFDIEDILYSLDKSDSDPINNAFFLPPEIFPTTSLTISDYRRLIIDRIQGVRNVWIEPLNQSVHQYNGLFKVFLQLADGINKKFLKDQIINRVNALIMDNRNLCEDLYSIEILESENITIEAEITISPDAFGEFVLANIYYELEEYLNPAIRYFSKAELLDEGYSLDEIYEGPIPYFGFIKSEDLRPKPSSIYESKLREIITAIEGVQVVNKIIVRKEGKRIEGDEIVPSENNYLTLGQKIPFSNLEKDYISLKRVNVPVQVNYPQARQYLNNLTARNKKGYRLEVDHKTPRRISKKKLKDIEKYVSFQPLFPTVYGIGNYGIPKTANRERVAQAKQLKAYLIIFEQFLASHLSQLTAVRQLFSIKKTEEENLPKTYFPQFPFSIPDALSLMKTTKKVHEINERTSAGIAKLKNVQDKIKEFTELNAKKFDPHIKRRNRFLDHLLARFGEVYSGDLLSKMQPDGFRDEKLSYELIQAKTEYLRSYESISKERSKAFNYRKSSWNNDNVSGLEKRVSLLLNFSGLENMNDQAVSEADQKDDKSKVFMAPFQNRELAANSLLKSVNVSSDKEKKTSNLKLPFKKILKHGTDLNYYDIVKETKNKYSLYFIQADQSYLISKNQKSIDACEEIRNNLISKLTLSNTLSEGFFLLEHILLRPSKNPGFRMTLKLDQSDIKQIAPSDKLADSYILLSPIFGSLDNLDTISTDLLIFGVHKKNYLILEGKPKKEKNHSNYFILLKRDTKPALASPDNFTKSEAEKFRDKLISTLKRVRNDDPKTINDLTETVKEQFVNFDEGRSFYSLQMSVILPDWPSRLQDHDFRRFFQQIVAANIPAHLSVNYHWLPFEKMKEFEKTFKFWLQEKSRNIINHDALHNRSIQLFELLNGPPEDSVQKKDKEVNQIHLSEDLFRAIKDELGYGYFFQSDDLQIIDGIDPAIETLLKSNDIYHWKDLMKLKASDLNLMLKKAPDNLTQLDPASWPKQAKMACKGQWSELERLQKKMTAGSLPKTKYENPSKVEQFLQKRRQNKELVLNRITAWNIQRKVQKMEIPFSMVDSAIKEFNSEFLIQENNFNILLGLTPTFINTLHARNIKTWDAILDLGISKILELSEKSEDQKLQGIAPTFLFDQIIAAKQCNWDDLLQMQREFLNNEATTFELEFNRLFKVIQNDANIFNKRLRIFVQNEVPERFFAAFLNQANYETLLTNSDLQIVDGIDSEIEEILKGDKLKTWSDIERASKQKIRETLKEGGRTMRGINIDSWRHQLNLAKSNKWKALVEYQKELKTLRNKDSNSAKIEERFEAWLIKHAVK